MTRRATAGATAAAFALTVLAATTPAQQAHVATQPASRTQVVLLGVDNCRKCDVLIHEAYAEDYRPADMASWLEYRAKHHTATAQLAELAGKAEPGRDRPGPRRLLKPLCPGPPDPARIPTFGRSHGPHV